MTDIRPGMRVRVTRGLHAGTQGRVVDVHLSGGPHGPWARVERAALHDIQVHFSALEPIAETPTLRDRVTVVLEAVRAQRDREAELAEARGEEACCHEYAHALLEETIAALTQAMERGVIAERDRLKARHAELMRLADRAFRRRKASYEGSQLIAMARELEPTIAALTALAGDGQGLEEGS